jgi:hypothetical protein
MSSFFRSGWQVQFLEADLKTALPRKLSFRAGQDPRAGEVRLGATQRAGRCSSARSKPAGGVFLRPTPEQHSSLTHP